MPLVPSTEMNRPLRALKRQQPIKGYFHLRTICFRFNKHSLASTYAYDNVQHFPVQILENMGSPEAAYSQCMIQRCRSSSRRSWVTINATRYNSFAGPQIHRKAVKNATDCQSYIRRNILIVFNILPRSMATVTTEKRNISPVIMVKMLIGANKAASSLIRPDI